MDPSNPNTLSTDALLSHFLKLEQNGRIQATYVWIGGTGMDLRMKTRTLDKAPKAPSDLPVWNFDGSSTGQAPGDDSEVLLKPVRIYKDPFRPGNGNILVLCECVLPDFTPALHNHRAAAAPVFEKVTDEHPWFGIEQEYTMFNSLGRPLGWPADHRSYPGAQGPYYCSVGAENNFGRTLVEAHYRACLYAGVKISGTNAEVMPGQHEFQVGPCEGIQMGDDLWMARYLLNRCGEFFNITISYDPKPIPGDWNGAGCHTNYSTEAMRKEGGMAVMVAAIEKLGKKHAEHIAVYGADNDKRLTGRHETASIDKFSYGVADRGASIRIPRDAEKQGYGYFEDRRPGSNIDPYVVTAKIVQTTILD